jgi:hypothetical protein
MSEEIVDWESKALEYAAKLKELVVVIKEEREANRKVRSFCGRFFFFSR